MCIRDRMIFEDLQNSLRHDVLLHLFHAQPISEEELDKATETDLTRAARGSVSNASQITTAETEFEAEDFANKKNSATVKKKASNEIKKARKKERKRKTAAKRRKK